MRLPDIDYGVGKVAPLAKKSTDHIEKNLETEVNLSRARLGAELNKAQEVGQANIRLARRRGEIAKDLIRTKADIQNQITAHKYDQKSATTSTIVSSISSLAQTGISSYMSWHAANEEAKVSKGITDYSGKISALTNELSSSRTVDLTKHKDVDFSSIPENMIYSGTDPVTGQEVKTAPSHLAAPLVFAAQEEKIRSQALEGIDSDYSIAQFENGVSQKLEAATARVTKAAYDNEASFLSGQYQEALTSAVGQEDFATSVDIINSAEARGVWSVEKAAKARSSLQGDIKFTRLVRLTDEATTLDQLKQVREAAGELPVDDMMRVRSVVNQKEGRIQKELDRAEVIKERTTLNLNTETALDAGYAAGGDFENQRAAVVAWAKKHDPENLNHYTGAFRTRYNQSKNAEKARVNDIVDQAAEAIYNDPRAPIPPEATGQDYLNLQKLKAKRISGEPGETNMKRWNELYDIATNEPEKFKKMALGPEMANLSEADFKYFKKLQGEMRGGTYDQTQTQSADGQFNSFARQAFGKNYADKDEAMQLRQAYINSVDQFEQEKKGKSTAAERQSILNDLFSSRVSTYSKGMFGGVREKTATMVKSEMGPYIPAISTLLKERGVRVTADNIAKQYNFMLENGTLEELAW